MMTTAQQNTATPTLVADISNWQPARYRDNMSYEFLTQKAHYHLVPEYDGITFKGHVLACRPLANGEPVKLDLAGKANPVGPYYFALPEFGALAASRYEEAAREFNPWPATCTFPNINEHISTALSCDFRIYILQAYGTSHRLIGGIRALLLASVTHECFLGKSCEFRELNTDTRTSPKFERKATKATILGHVDFMERHKLLTPEQCAQLRGKA